MNATVTVEVGKSRPNGKGVVHRVQALLVEDVGCDLRLAALLCDPPLMHPSAPAILADIEYEAAWLINCIYLYANGLPKNVDRIDVALTPLYTLVVVNGGHPDGPSFSQSADDVAVRITRRLARYVEEAD